MYRLAFASCSVRLVEHWGLVPDCKASRELRKGCSDENNSWPAGLEITEVVCLSLSSSLLYVLSGFIYCVFLWYLEESVQMDVGWKGFIVSYGDPGWAASGKEVPCGSQRCWPQTPKLFFLIQCMLFFNYHLKGEMHPDWIIREECEELGVEQY